MPLPTMVAKTLGVGGLPRVTTRTLGKVVVATMRNGGRVRTSPQAATATLEGRGIGGIPPGPLQNRRVGWTGSRTMWKCHQRTIATSPAPTTARGGERLVACAIQRVSSVLCRQR